MATITISRGQTLGGIAKQYGTSINALMAANSNIKDANKISAGATLVIPDKPSTAPTTPAQQKDSSSINTNPATSKSNDIVSTLPQQQTNSSLNFQMAMKEAMNEAARNRKARMLGAFGDKVNTMSAMGSVVNMVNESVNTSATSIFKSVMDTENEKRKTALDMLKTLADDGSLAGMSNDALISMASTAGISSDTALAWKARIVEIKAMSDEKANLELQKLRADIRKTNSSGSGSGSGKEDPEDTAIVDGWAQAVIEDQKYMTQVPKELRSAVQSRVVSLKQEAVSKGQQEYKSTLDYNLEKKITTFDDERAKLSVQMSAGMPAEDARMYADYIDAKEEAMKGKKKSLFSSFGISKSGNSSSSQSTPPPLLSPNFGSGLSSFTPSGINNFLKK